MFRIDLEFYLQGVCLYIYIYAYDSSIRVFILGVCWRLFFKVFLTWKYIKIIFYLFFKKLFFDIRALK